MVMYVRKLSLASLVPLHSYIAFIGAAPIGIFGEYCKQLVNELLTDLPELQTRNRDDKVQKWRINDAVNEV